MEASSRSACHTPIEAYSKAYTIYRENIQHTTHKIRSIHLHQLGLRILGYIRLYSPLYKHLGAK